MKRIINLLQDLLFPASCVSCGIPVLSANSHLCGLCMEDFEEIGDGCPVCSGVVNDSICTICSDRFFYPEKHISLMKYEKTVKSAIHALKFDGLKHIYRIFIPYICEKIPNFNNNIDIITSVPMNRRKVLKRGYNQSELMARGVAQRAGVVYYELLRERRNSLAQRSLNYDERFINVIDRYETVNNNKISGRSVLLIDDVFTTGATINECSRMLLAAGAVRVYALTVVRSDLRKLENV